MSSFVFVSGKASAGSATQGGSRKASLIISVCRFNSQAKNHEVDWKQERCPSKVPNPQIPRVPVRGSLPNLTPVNACAVCAFVHCMLMCILGVIKDCKNSKKFFVFFSFSKKENHVTVEYLVRVYEMSVFIYFVIIIITIIIFITFIYLFFNYLLLFFTFNVFIHFEYRFFFSCLVCCLLIQCFPSGALRTSSRAGAAWGLMLWGLSRMGGRGTAPSGL